MGGTRKPNLWRILGAGSGVVLGTAGVVWTLATPERDPVGDALVAVGEPLGAVRDWFASGPVDATPPWAQMQLQVLMGDADEGRGAIVAYGCGSCHIIPGVAGARGTVGPSLENFADRAYIAGILPNKPGNLTRWLINPPLFAPKTSMPDMQVSDRDAADMAAYLYTLRADG